MAFYQISDLGELLDAVAEKIPGLGDMKINDISIFNNLIQHTNHPIVVLVFYVYYFLLRTEYGFGWIFNFMLLTCGDIAFKAGLAKKFADEAAVRAELPYSVTGPYDMFGGISAVVQSRLVEVIVEALDKELDKKHARPLDIEQKKRKAGEKEKKPKQNF